MAQASASGNAEGLLDRERETSQPSAGSTLWEPARHPSRASSIHEIYGACRATRSQKAQWCCAANCAVVISSLSPAG